jgi:hypothetical protein
MVNEANNLGDAVVDRETEQGMKPIADPFFENVERMPPRRELEAELEKWKRRALTFQEAYRDKSFEVTSLEIQLMDLRAHGADVVTARQNKSLRDKLVAVCFERNLAMKVADAARDFIWEQDTWECYVDSQHSTSADWPPEFVLLGDAVTEHYGDKSDDATSYKDLQEAYAALLASKSVDESAKRPISDETNHGQADETKSS